MHIRPKLFLLIFAIALGSLLLLSIFSYWQNTRESSLRDNLRRDADWIALRINFALSEREASLIQLARSSALRDYLQSHPPRPEFKRAFGASGKANSTSGTSHPAELPGELRTTITAFLLENRNHYGAFAGLNMAAEPLFRAAITSGDASRTNEPPTVTFQTENLPPNNGGPESIGGDIKFIGARDGTPLSTLIERGPVGPALRFTVPVLGNEPAVVVGALVVDLRLDQLFKERASDVVGALNGAPTGMETSRVVIVVHHDGQIYYHSNKTLNYQSVASAMPDFKPIADAMMAGGTGAMFYESSNHDRWLASYRPLGQLDLALAVATNYTGALQPARRALLVNILASILIAFMAALALTVIAQQLGNADLAP